MLFYPFRNVAADSIHDVSAFSEYNWKRKSIITFMQLVIVTPSRQGHPYNHQ